jgi:hypothetical protein
MVTGIKRKAIYAGTLVTIMALVAGFAIASIAFTTNSQNGAGNATITGSVAGISLPTQPTTLGIFAATSALSAQGTPTANIALANGANVFCVSATCTAGDFSESFTINFASGVAGFTGALYLQVVATATSGSVSATLFLSNAGGANAGTIVVEMDLGTAANTLNTGTLVYQQCAGVGACP